MTTPTVRGGPQSEPPLRDAPAVLFFGNDWLAENRTSSHHIARRLAKRFRVFYIECPGLRQPKGSGRDLRKIVQKLWRFLRGAAPAEGGVRVQTLLQLPLHRFSWVRRLNGWLMSAILRGLMRRHGVRRPITWFMLPHLAPVVGRLGEALSVYYCIDDYASFPDMDEAAVRAMDAETTRAADLVFVASDTLLEAKRRLNPEVRVSPHGVDFSHFARAQDDDLEVPADAARLKGPVVGYFGLVERWIDLKLIDYLAARRPEWTFLMLGRVAAPPEQLPQRRNILFPGKKPYSDLPAYGKRFDAAVIPYRLNKQVLHANPIKLREYLAMGKPVIAVSTPEIEKYKDVVAVARSPEEFLAKLDAALSGPASPEEVRRRMDRVASESWDARLDKVLAVVEGRLAGRGESPATPVADRATAVPGVSLCSGNG
jgi:glycosyltransferase involved in cell wall biosynthesis